MASLYLHKEDQVLQTPLLLFEIKIADGREFYWSTHDVVYGSRQYQARVVSHGDFHLHLDTDLVYPSSGALSIVIANVDGLLDNLLSPSAWRGATVKARFIFYDLKTDLACDDSKVLFLGSCQGLEDITETTVRLTFHTKMRARRAYIASTLLQARCPWEFPSTYLQRSIAASGGEMGSYSPLFRCGYSPDIPQGRGNPGVDGPYTSCSYTRADCQLRGMLDVDNTGTPTRRFGGTDVSGAGESSSSGSRSSTPAIPLVYGAGWVKAPVIRSCNEGASTAFYAAIGHGPVQQVLRVVVNDYEIPRKDNGRNMEATGFFSLISAGSREGVFDADSSFGSDIGPLGGVAYLKISVPSSLVSSQPEIKVEALVEGLLLSRFDPAGNPLGISFTNNPAWVILDLLRRAGWSLVDLDLPSFGVAAASCDGIIDIPTGDGESLAVTRRRCNLVIESPESIGDLLRGICVAAGLFLRHNADGRLGLVLEGALSSQQPQLPAGSNCASPFDGGYPAYEFGDGTNGLGGIVRRANGRPAIRRWSNPSSETANKASTVYIDEFGGFRKNTLSVSEVDDIVATGQELSVSVRAIGLTNFAHAFIAVRRYLRRTLRGNVFVEFDSSVKAVNLHPGDLITITYPKFGFNRTLFRVLRTTVGLNGSTIKLLAQFHEDDWYDEIWPSFVRGGRADSRNLTPRPIMGTLIGSDGSTDFGLQEQTFFGADGSSGVVLVADFIHPRRLGIATPTAPLLSGEPFVSASGMLTSAATYYYAVCGIDSNGDFTELSSTVRVTLASDGSQNAVRLFNIISSVTLPKLAIYRGTDPARLKLIGSDVPRSATFVDVGYPQQNEVPPDRNYDHTNLYWREELIPPCSTDITSATTIGNSSLSLPDNAYIGRAVRITGGRGSGQERIVVSNTSTTFYLANAWASLPDTSSTFSIVDTNWRSASSTNSSPARFEIPNRPGMGIEITGRSTNASNVESSSSLAPITRHTVAGTSGSGVDTTPPPEPFYGMTVSGLGTVSVVGLSFISHENILSLSNGQLTLYYWNELSATSDTHLTLPADPNDTVLSIFSDVIFTSKELLQIDREIVRVEHKTAENTYQVTRALLNTEAGSFPAGEKCYVLSSRRIVVPLRANLFLGPDAGEFTHPIFIPDVRVAASTMFVSNSRGNSPVRAQNYLGTSSFGLRTLSGGQYSIQSPGYLAIEDGVAPPLVIEASHSVSDISATIREAPTGSPVQLRLRVDGNPYCTLSIGPGSTVSNVVDGLDLKPLDAGSVLTLDVVSVGTAVTDSPGRDLTVTIRL